VSGDDRGLIDRTRPVRPGEELDRDALAGYLAPRLDGAAGLGGDELSIEQFPGGHSNLTYLVRLRGRELVLRRPPFGSRVKTAHDMGREYRVLSNLAPVYPRAPRPLLHCDDPAVLGAPFYLMERLTGIILRREPPAGMALPPPTCRALCEVLIDALVELHAIDYVAAGLGELGKPDGYVARQVAGWTARYGAAQTDEIAAIERVAGWLAAHQPASPPPTLLHNDFKFDNLVLDPADPTRIRGVLDWEMSTLGDPLMDLGTALGYWVEERDPPAMKALVFGPTMRPGMLSRAELAARYAERSGRSIDHVVFYYAFGLFKTAVVAQQIYVRWKQGLTRDERFAAFILGVRALADQASRAIDAGSL
jgi:aminoglycoside phosphotransferase (APT) family kinase protein